MSGFVGRYFLALSLILAFIRPSVSLARNGTNTHELTVSIHSQEDGGETRCTATLIKLDDGVCHLLTAYHCVPGTNAPAVFLQEAPIAVQVLKRDSLLDLAELSNPLPESSCSGLSPISTLSLNDVLAEKNLALVAQGFVDHDRLHDTYSQNNPQEGISQARLYQHGPSADEVFFEFSELKIIPGMSGGIVFESHSKQVLGLISHLVPFQKLAYVVPVSVLRSFLETGTNRVRADDDAFKLWHMINGAIVSGDNSQVGGGNNSPAAGRITNFNGYVRSLTKPFQEPEEGVTLQNSHQILLAVNGVQIDGGDDYYLKYSPIAAQHPTLITREVGDYPELSVRQGLLERLKGSYVTGTNPVGDATLYVEAHDVAEGFKETANAQAPVQIQVSPEEHLITFHFLPFNLKSTLDSGDTIAMKENVLKFFISVSDDAKTIYATDLANPKQYFACDNNNYLKLICADDTGLGFSLSLSQGGPSGVLSYRFAHMAATPDAKLLVNYYYGKLGASP